MRRILLSRPHERKRLSILIVVVLSLSFSTLSWIRAEDDTDKSEAALPLVKEKEAQAVIVVANERPSSVSYAVKVLVDHIEQISGARLQILTERKLKDVVIEGDHVHVKNRNASTLILVGESELSKAIGITTEGLDLGSILIKTKGNTLSLLGGDEATHPTQAQASDPNATTYAVVTFLEKQLGVRYLWPGDSGKVVPKQETIVITPIDLRHSPIVKQRHIRDLDYANTHYVPERTALGLERMALSVEEYTALLRKAAATESTTPTWFIWNKAGGTLGLATGHSYDHMWKKYGKDHPEWFAMQPDGSRDQSRSPTRPRLEVSNPEVWQAIARERIETIEKTKQTSVSIDPSDGGYNTFSMSPESKALDPSEGRKITLTDYTSKPRKPFEYVSLTDRYVFFWNHIAEIVTEKYPDVLLTARAYSAYTAPPLKRKLHPNIVIEQVSKDYYDKKKVQLFLDDWTEWSKMTGQPLAWRPNLDTPHRRHGLPTFLTQRMAADVKARVAIGMTSADIGSAYKSWAQHSLNLYILTQLLWDPSLEVDELIRDYCEAGFGAGAPFVQDYYARIEAITEKAAEASISNPDASYDESQMVDSLVESYSEVGLNQLSELLDKAQEAVNNDPEITPRLNFLRRGLQYARFQAEAFRILKASQDDRESLNIETMTDFFKARYEMMREIVFNDPLAMDIPHLLWGSDAKFRKLQSEEARLALSGNQPISTSPSKPKEVMADEDGNVEQVD